MRDRLLGREAKDIDIATNASPDQVQGLFPRVTGLEGKCFGVVRVLVGLEMFEVATFRQDGAYQDGRRPTSVEFSTPEEDAKRRDFTVNGMFFDPLAGKVIDFVGGQGDLEKKLIRAIGIPADRFTEDKLRLLRAIRFAVNLGFEIESETWQAIQKFAPEIRVVSVERIRDELDKIWTGPDPARGLDLLDQSGLLREVLPEVSALHGVEQPPQFHPEGDVFIHTRLMLSHLKNAPLPLALSVLLHDIGKKPTMKVDETGRIRFNEHECVGARMTESLLTRLRYSNEIIDEVFSGVLNHMAFKDVPKMRLSKLKRFLSRPTFEMEMELHRIDCLSSHRDLTIYEWIQETLRTMPAESIKPPRLVTGEDLKGLGIAPGKAMGEILKQIEDAQLEGTIASKEEGLELAKTLWKNSG